MQTLPTNLRKLVTENDQQVRDALRKLRQSEEKEVTIHVKDGPDVVIKPLRSDESAR